MWRTLWLTALLIVTTTAVRRLGSITIDSESTNDSPPTPFKPPETPKTDSSDSDCYGTRDDNEGSGDDSECPVNSNGDNNGGSDGESGDGEGGDGESGDGEGDDPDCVATGETGDRSSSCTTEGNDSSSDESTTDQDNGDRSSNVDDSLLVETKSGRIQGYMWGTSDIIVSYIDIPYGSIKKPFQAAVPFTPWDDTHKEKEHDKRCPQIEIRDNEYTPVDELDCLTLSIFKPLDAENASVLFHIHSENFNSGDPSIYGPEYLVSEGIILVLPNYRLGPLGFLCTHNETAPGNLGLKDLSLGLKWIHDNIKFFDGNPDNIAVSGDGKSGALAGLLALSPMSKDYVSKVIAESGSLLSYWALDRNPTDTAAELMTKIQETYSGRDIPIEDVPIRDILMAAKDIEFRPCIETDDDDAFMVQVPYKTITSSKFEEVTFLLGSAKYAGAHEVLLQTKDSIGKFNEDFTLLLPSDLSFATTTLRHQAGERVKTQYFGTEDIRIDDIEGLSNLFTDIGYLGPGIRSARLLVAAGATVYFYEFGYKGKLNRELQSIKIEVDGAVRGDIVGYLFTQDGVVPPDGSDERKMVDTLTRMWLNYLKSGSPSTDTLDWSQLDATDYREEEWLVINSSSPVMQKGIHLNRIPLWTELYHNHFIDNHARELSPSVYIVLVLQLIFWLAFCRNASHLN